jgi:alpha-L-fucosidase 2
MVRNELPNNTNAVRLWETEPATQLVDAHLLGNGRMGGAVFGSVDGEQIVINEDTLWSGSESFLENPEALASLPEARRLIFAGKFADAHQLVADRMLGQWGEAFEPLGTLRAQLYSDAEPAMQFAERFRRGAHEEYSRSLDLDSAIASVDYVDNGRRFHREAFVSHPDQVLALRLSVATGDMHVILTLESALRSVASSAGDALVLTGRAPDLCQPDYDPKPPTIVYLPDDETPAIRFAAVARVIDTDGDVSDQSGGVVIRGATRVTILVAAHTNYAGYAMDRDADTRPIVERCEETLRAAAERTYEELKNRHIEDHRSLFRRVSVAIGPATTEAVPTTKRMELHVGPVEDPSMAALMLQYSRYLLIASSRPGSQPANLQGVWNDRVQPPWSSNFTTNINVEMNYWVAEVLGLQECHEPLFDLIADLADSGRRTAREWYGIDGWTAHHNTDLWRKTTPCAGLPSWSYWPMAGGWLSQHLWRHYEYSGDKEFLRERAYPIMEDAARFLLEFLVEDEEGYLSTAPSTSPENSFFVDRSSASDAELLNAVSPHNRMDTHEKTSAVSKSSTMDLSIIRELLEHCLEAADVLDIRGEIHEQMVRALERLYPFKIGSHGQLQEWCFDFAECMPGMGHVSHMYGLFPGDLFTSTKNQELYEACRKSVFRRRTHGAFTRGGGWPSAWAVSLFARLKEAEEASLVLKGSLKGLGANLMTQSHLQLDCAFGLGAGVAEMLLQSHETTIELLPALPGSWRTGTVRGMRARGGFQVAFSWENGMITECEILSHHGGACTLKGPGIGTKELQVERGAVYHLESEDHE